MTSSAAYIGLAMLATGAGVVLAALALSRSKSPLSLPVTLLALDQFAWNAATVGLHLTHDEAWRWIGAAAAPLFLPFSLHFTLAFVGRRRALRGLLIATYVVFGAQAAGAAATSLIPALRSHGLGIWSAVLGLTIVPVAALGFVLVVRHLRAADTGLERARSALFLVALGVVAVFASTDLLHDIGFASVPPLSHVGSFAFNSVLGVLAFRLGLLDEGDTVRSALLAVLVGLGGAAVALLSFLLLEDNLALIAVAVGSATLIVAVVTRRVTTAMSAQRASMQRAANLGRFSAQMAHDLKNPIAAARGAIQFLEEEARQGRSLNEQVSFLGLVGAQLERMTATVDRYQRLAKVEPALDDVDVAALVARVLSLERFAAGPGLELTTGIPGNLPHLRADADLLGTALENLVKNAVEALPGGKGTITVRAEVAETSNGEVLVLAVADTGLGMNARTRERAFEPFFTTKADGTGIGLPWVNEVARAHGGSVRLHSHEGSGTVVELVLPLTGTPGGGGP